jgi:cystathionine beta-synthase
MFNDDWMRDRGFLDEEKTNALELIKDHAGKHLVTVTAENPVSQAILLMNQYGISQIPVVGDDGFVGSLTDNHLFAKLCENPELKELPVKNIMESAFPVVSEDTPIDKISQHFQNGANAQQDMIKAIA